MRTSLVSLVSALAWLVAILVPASGASPLAQDDGSTQYEGTHEAGGTIRFTVAPLGDRIRTLELEGIAGGGCSWDTIDASNWGGSIPIADNALEAANADGDVIRGTFPAPFRAEGTVQIADPTRGCSTPPLRWTATAPEPRAPSASGLPPAPTPIGTAAPALRGVPQQAPKPQAQPQQESTQAVATGGGGGGPARRPRGNRAARYCGAGEQPAFQEGLASLKARLGDVMGDPAECDHPNFANGDTLQQTTRGLAYYRYATSLPTFTDGWRHWALDGGNLIEWEGESPDPPR